MNILHALILMLATIKFNDKLLFNAGKVGNVGSNGVLASKSVCINLFVAYDPPQLMFNIGHSAT